MFQKRKYSAKVFVFLINSLIQVKNVRADAIAANTNIRKEQLEAHTTYLSNILLLTKVTD